MKNAIYLSLFFFALFLLCSGCATEKTSVKEEDALQTVRTAPTPVVDYTGITRDFLARCEADLKKSSDVISEKSLITALSHLNKMGSGGNHYYLLEKQAISKMLNSLGAYTYSDCYLVDARGKIVYTMYNDELLGKKVTHYPSSPLPAMYFSGMKDQPMICDVAEFPIMSRSYDVYFSRPVKKNGELHGILITAVNIDNLSKELPASSMIISRTQGTFMFHYKRELITTSDSIFVSSLEENDSVKQSARYNNSIYQYQPVIYKNISWILALKENGVTALNE